MIRSVQDRKPPAMSWTQFVKKGIGTRVSRLGERLNSRPLQYNPWLFIVYHQLALENREPFGRTVMALFPEARRLLDVGAGSGAYAAWFNDRGLDAIALEHSAGARRLARRQGVDARPFDLAVEPPADSNGGFDLAYSLEVAEHLPAPLGDRLVRFLAESAPIVVFTAAPPGQGGVGHVNEQPKPYWIERFRDADMGYDEDAARALADELRRNGVTTGWFLIENAMVFRREATDP